MAEYTIEEPLEVGWFKADADGRITLGRGEYANKNVRVVVEEVEDPGEGGV